MKAASFAESYGGERRRKVSGSGDRIHLANWRVSDTESVRVRV